VGRCQETPLLSYLILQHGRPFVALLREGRLAKVADAGAMARRLALPLCAPSSEPPTSRPRDGYRSGSNRRPGRSPLLPVRPVVVDAITTKTSGVQDVGLDCEILLLC
jgi:hypothetical protein